MVLLLGRFVAAAHTGRCRMCKIWDIVLGGILIMAAFTQIVEQASDILWNYLLLFLLVGTGIFFTIKLHFVQLSSLQMVCVTCSKVSACTARQLIKTA